MTADAAPPHQTITRIQLHFLCQKTSLWGRINVGAVCFYKPYKTHVEYVSTLLQLHDQIPLFRARKWRGGAVGRQTAEWATAVQDYVSRCVSVLPLVFYLWSAASYLPFHIWWGTFCKPFTGPAGVDGAEISWTFICFQKTAKKKKIGPCVPHKGKIMVLLKRCF